MGTGSEGGGEEYDPFIKSQLASRNEREGLFWCISGHVTVQNVGGRNQRFGSRGSGCGFIYLAEVYLHPGVCLRAVRFRAPAPGRVHAQSGLFLVFSVECLVFRVEYLVLSVRVEG